MSGNQPASMQPDASSHITSPLETFPSLPMSSSVAVERCSATESPATGPAQPQQSSAPTSALDTRGLVLCAFSRFMTQTRDVLAKETGMAILVERVRDVLSGDVSDMTKRDQDIARLALQA